jgi:hypothetical protein
MPGSGAKLQKRQSLVLVPDNRAAEEARESITRVGKYCDLLFHFSALQYDGAKILATEGTKVPEGINGSS